MELASGDKENHPEEQRKSGWFSLPLEANSIIRLQGARNTTQKNKENQIF
jgi:hypothetical protein